MSLAGWLGQEGREKQWRDKNLALEQTIARFNREVQVASSQIASVSEQLGISVEENSMSAQEVFDETAEMRAMYAKAQACFDEMLEYMRQLTRLMDEQTTTSGRMKIVCESAENVIAAGLQDLETVMEAMDQILDASHHTRENVVKLTDISQGIQRILAEVEGIAGQTQLLAFNASIEAARAGNAGNGFRVIAEEIRKLSGDTSAAVRNIQKLTLDIYQEVKSLVTVTQENTLRVSQGVENSRKIVEILEDIRNSFSHVMAMVQKLDEITAQETRLTGALDEEMDTTEHMVATTSGKVVVVYDSVHKQKHEMEGIMQMSTRLNQASAGLAGLMEETDNGTEMDEARIHTFRQEFQEIYTRLEREQLLAGMDEQTHRKVLLELMETADFIEAIWTNDTKGRFICSIPDSGIANAGVREWFRESAAGREYVSPIYFSAITRKPCVTLSAPIRGMDGKVFGVVGIDVKLDDNC